MNINIQGNYSKVYTALYLYPLAFYFIWGQRKLFTSAKSLYPEYGIRHNYTTGGREGKTLLKLKNTFENNNGL
jgi:hypothetical protein